MEIWPVARHPAAPAVARTHVADLCGGLPRHVFEAALLLTSEVVTNALRHGTGEITMTVDCGTEHVRVAVQDEEPRLPTPRHPSFLDEGGRGLMLVDAYADSWGVLPTDHGKTVWFVLSTGPSDSGR